VVNCGRRMFMSVGRCCVKSNESKCYVMGRVGMTEKQDKVVTLLHELKTKRFTGFIKINFSQGGITRIEKNEEILKNNELNK